MRLSAQSNISLASLGPVNQGKFSTTIPLAMDTSGSPNNAQLEATVRSQLKANSMAPPRQYP